MAPWPRSVREAHYEGQGDVETPDIGFEQPPDRLANPFPPDRDGLVGHDLRTHAKAILFVRFDGIALDQSPAGRSGLQAITRQIVRRFARSAHERLRFDGGGYRHVHLRTLAQLDEVADREVRIIGSKRTLLHTLTVAVGVKPATPGVRSSVLTWRRGRDSNPGYP